MLPATAVEQFSSNNLSQNDARVIQLSSAMVKTHMKQILYLAVVVVVGQQAAWPGWGDGRLSLVVKFPAAPIQ